MRNMRCLFVKNVHDILFFLWYKFPTKYFKRGKYSVFLKSLVRKMERFAILWEAISYRTFEVEENLRKVMCEMHAER